ncbi:hypothetical protein BDC45DRAFT_296703 [Circinella umbellata]|nr:hypothetical protein BDC45DRAFT_296703 [Circinella umbellata]
MSTFGIKKGGRRFKPKPSDTSRVRKRLRKDSETNEEQQQTPHPVQQQQEQTEQVVKEIYQDTHDSFIYDNDTFESTIPTQMELAHSSSPPASSVPSPSRLPIVPLSQDLIYSTLLDYTSNKKKRKRVHGPSKEQLILMAEKEQEEKERQKVKQKEVANKNSISLGGDLTELLIRFPYHK